MLRYEHLKQVISYFIESIDTLYVSSNDYFVVSEDPDSTIDFDIQKVPTKCNFSASLTFG